MAVQKVRRYKASTESACEYKFFYGKGNENHELGIGFFVHKRIIPAVKRVEFVSDSMLYIILRGRWCDIILPNVRPPTEDKIDVVRDRFYEELEGVFDEFPKYHMKSSLVDFNTKVCREDILKPTTGNESLNEISIDNGVRVVNFATSKNVPVNSTTFQHRNIHKFTWTSPDGKSHNQIDHTLIDRRRHSSTLDVQSFRASDCDTNYYLMVEKVRERLAVNKQKTHRVHMVRFSLKKLNKVESKKQYHVEISNWLAPLENIHVEVDINRVWETTGQNIKISPKESLGYHELKKHKPWFNNGCSELLDQRKQAKLQWIQDPSEINGDNLNNIRCEASRNFRNKKREYLKEKN
jgi:hypothetical protein